MHPALRKALKSLVYTISGLIAFVALYMGAAYVLARIPVAAVKTDAPTTITIFVRSNGVHTDLVVPVKNDQVDWSQQVRYANTKSNDPSFDYVGIGWGDKGFYLDTPTWAELKVSTALRAGFWLSTTAMHATFYRLADLRPGPACVTLHLSRAEYSRLINYIQNSFDHDQAGNVELIPGHSYGSDDAFYEAQNTYSLFYTCNSWTNNGLKAAGQKASLWTPFETGIFYQYGRTGKPLGSD